MNRESERRSQNEEENQMVDVVLEMNANHVSEVGENFYCSLFFEWHKNEEKFSVIYFV